MTSLRSIENIALRRAIAPDVEWAAPLLFATGPALFSYIFAAPIDQAREIVRQAFVYPQHAFSYEHTQVIEVQGQPVGIMISYPGTLKRQADDKVHSVMARLIPLRRLPKILVNVADLTRIKQDVASADYYILGISIFSDFRNRGLGTYLLTQAEQQAREHGCQTVCADITYTNTRAKALLERNSYRISCSKTTPRFDQMTRAGGLHRLIKPLSAPVL